VTESGPKALIAYTGDVATPLIKRTTVVHTDALRVELMRCPLGREPIESYTTERQVLLPLGGAFHWQIGRTTRFVDGNQVAFIVDDEVSHDSHPIPTVVTCLLITVAAPTVQLLWGAAARDPVDPVDPFRLRTALASSRLQASYAWYAAAVRRRGEIEPLVWEEHAIELLGMATACARRATSEPSPGAAARLAARAKQLLGDRDRPLGLTSIATTLGVSPTYLTDAFRRAEGIPLVRYQLQLRLLRALAELPHAGDLTALALELGFASHSHFSTAFRAAIGVTPSQYRERARRGVQLPRSACDPPSTAS
jgi:AraC-like DNA-binding protein